MIDFLLNLLDELRHIPGLGFLGNYWEQILAKRGEISQKVGDIEARRDGAINGMKALRNAPRNIKGSKKRD
jgi:hypothetical protein